MKKERNNVVVTCPPCGENVALATKRGFLNKETSLTNPHRPYRALPPQVGKLTSRAFTLIELLVVVLIIGILATVAVPQYQKAVEKSKATQALSLLKTVYAAAKVYYLANGTWPDSFSKLDVEIPWTGTQNWASPGHYRQGYSDGDWSIQLRAPLQDADAGNAEGVVVGRISGPYAGAAFHFYQSSPDNVPLEKVLCVEGKNSVLHSQIYNKFTKERGDYCEKLFHATYKGSGAAEYVFEMP